MCVFQTTQCSGLLLVISHAQSVDLSGEVVDALRARLQLLRQGAPSCGQVRAHLWHSAPVVSRHQRNLNPGPSALVCFRQYLLGLLAKIVH